MTTLIAAYNSDGCIGRCDAKCHNAKEPRCSCICGGKNHGVGTKQAVANMPEITEEIMQEWIEKWDPEGTGHRVVRAPVMFGLD